MNKHQLKIIIYGGMKMGYTNYRKHPRNYKKKTVETDERTLNFSVGTALGIVAFTFVNGLGLGYMLKKKIR
jgi:hypothetical protein